MNKIAITSVIWLVVSAVGGVAQDEASDFSPDSAILDTTIPFAIGAREATQELRGSYGWPTFQEGLVEGVYFRFDPDGYARFSTTPRLDTDVFEVICRAKTVSCIGRKGIMTVQLNGQGALQVILDGVSTGDELFIVDGITELPLPDRILQPLDSRLEALLSSGGELVIRHASAEVARVPLSGFLAVSTYLRWIVSGQDYSIFPRGWPVPNSQSDSNAGALLTQSLNWEPPIRGAIPVLAELPAEEPVNMVSQTEAQLLIDVSQNQERIHQLTEALNQLTKASGFEQAIFEQSSLLDVPSIMQPVVPTAIPETGGEMALEHIETVAKTELEVLSTQLNYLMTEIGLDSASALALLQQPNELLTTPRTNSPSDQIVSEILLELKEKIAENELPLETTETVNPEIIAPSDGVIDTATVRAADSNVSAQDYLLLSQYFKSVFVE
ncbi:MAG: hypothetical protein V3U96_10810 [Paracoccaceae bacterium]